MSGQLVSMKEGTKTTPNRPVTRRAPSSSSKYHFKSKPQFPKRAGSNGFNKCHSSGQSLSDEEKIYKGLLYKLAAVRLAADEFLSKSFKETDRKPLPDNLKKEKLSAEAKKHIAAFESFRNSRGLVPHVEKYIEMIESVEHRIESYVTENSRDKLEGWQKRLISNPNWMNLTYFALKEAFHYKQRGHIMCELDEDYFYNEFKIHLDLQNPNFD